MYKYVYMYAASEDYRMTMDGLGPKLGMMQFEVLKTPEIQVPRALNALLFAIHAPCRQTTVPYTYSYMGIVDHMIIEYRNLGLTRCNIVWSHLHMWVEPKVRRLIVVTHIFAYDIWTETAHPAIEEGSG